MTSGILARRALCALGLLLLAGIGRPAAAQSPADPLQQPLWEFGATATTAAD